MSESIGTDLVPTSTPIAGGDASTDLVTLAVDQVIPYFRNPRRIPQDAVDAVAESIRRYGYQQPIVVDKDNVVIVGHTRLQAIKKLGYSHVQVHVAHLPEAKANEYRLVDNRIGEMTEWDHEALVAELREFESGLLASFFPEIDLEIGLVHSMQVTQADVDKATEDIKRVKEGETILTTEVVCPACYGTFKVRTDSLPGLTKVDLDVLAEQTSGAAE